RRRARRRPRRAARVARATRRDAGDRRHRARRARRPRRRPRRRRRRLHRQALRARRARRAHPRRAAPPCRPRRAPRLARRRHARPGAAARDAERSTGRAVGARVRRSRSADGTAGSGAVALAARGQALRLGRGDREQRGLGLHPPAAQEARRRPHSQRPRRRLLHRRRCPRAMNSLRLRLLVSLVGLLALAASAMAAITYHNVLGETEELFDYQLQQMALSLRDQGEIDPAQADTLADERLDVVIQIWTVDGRAIYASRPHASLPARALLGLATLTVDGRAWRTYGV